MRKATNPVDRFWKFVNKTESCWLWTGGKHVFGYGAFGLTRCKMVGAHRYSWELHHGPINNPKLVVCHKCDNPPCVNPEHLFLGTQKDNMQDASKKKRMPLGKRPKSAKLTARQVQIMRWMFEAGYGVGNIAAVFGVHQSNVSNIKAGRAWKSAL